MKFIEHLQYAVPVLKEFILQWMRVWLDIPTNSYAMLMNVTDFE